MPGGRSVPIIMITGQDDYDSINAAFQAGATDFAAKPLNPLLLCYRIRYITRANKAFDDLGISELKLAAAQELAGLSTWELDLASNSIEWNVNVCNTFGVAEEAYSGDIKFFYDIVHKDDLETVKDKIDKSIHDNQDINFEHRIIDKDKGVKIILHEGKISLDSRGKPARIVFISQDVTEKKKKEDEVRFLAFYDRLTELPNRLLYKEHLSKALADAKRAKSLLAVLFVDIDNFRMINDTFGRKTGDSLLKIIADRLRVCVRQNDTTAKMDDFDLTARFGADEFGVILENLNDLSDAAIVSRRIIDAVNNMIRIDDNDIFLHCRIGVSVYPDDGDTVDDLLRNADSALSRVKELEKDSYQFYTADLNSRAFARFALETRLRKAIEYEEFHLLYQPQVNLESRKVTGVEALIRWHHPDMGVVSPMDFIPIAEETGLIIPIGRWVLREAFAQCKKWVDKGHNIKVAVNLSALQFRDPKLQTIIQTSLADADVNPDLIEFEITESMLMEDVEGGIERMKMIKELGVHLSIDDFGTGYSSLNYLKRFPVDALKVDRSFVSDITVSEDDAMIVTAIVTLAKNLNLEVVAEGIELKEHLSFLNKLGCDHAQGYLISRPVPADKVEHFFNDWTTDDIS
jgi:diguanylate cyclase (GGDEF)-like protein/PAS domain S-box-containing protein